uniref:Uncharacterized protein n=1 Tax=Anguilla anguilla TaxID=7936 RepID=A0A0E9RIZ7_ANGAN
MVFWTWLRHLPKCPPLPGLDGCLTVLCCHLLAPPIYSSYPQKSNVVLTSLNHEYEAYVYRGLFISVGIEIMFTLFLFAMVYTHPCYQM